MKENEIGENNLSSCNREQIFLLMAQPPKNNSVWVDSFGINLFAHLSS